MAHADRSRNIDRDAGRRLFERFRKAVLNIAHDFARRVLIEAADELTDFGRVPRLGATEVEKGRGDGAEILRLGVGDRVGAIRAEMPQNLGLWWASEMRGAGAK